MQLPTKEIIQRYLSRPLVSRLLVSASIAFLLAASVYSAVQGSRVLNFTSDSFVSTYMSRDWRPGGTVNLVSQHTNIMKYPLLLVQGLLGYNNFNYLTVNVLLMFATLLGWSLLIWYLLKKSNQALICSNFMLGGLILSSTGLVISLVSTTTRNIEYPIALIYLILLQKVIANPSRKLWLIAGALLSILVATDYIFIYSLVPGVILLLGWLWYSGKISQQSAVWSASNLFAGTLAGLLGLKLLTVLHVLTLTGRHAGSFILFSALPSDFYNSLVQTAQLFGGYFLGTPIKLSYMGTLLAFSFMVVGFVATAQRIKYYKKYPVTAKTIAANFLPLALIAWSIALYAFYILLGQAAVTSGDNSRYISFLPFVAVFMIITQSARWRHYYALSAVTALIVLAGFINSYHNYYSYRDAASYANQQVSIDKKIISYANHNDIGLLLGSYDYGPALQFYAQNSLESRAILNCNNTFYFFSYEGWYTPKQNTKKSAVIVDKYFTASGRQNMFNSTNSCSEPALAKIYGTPLKKVHIADHAGQPVYLYLFNYDVRQKLSHSTILYL